jgi:hypothetical protein
MKNRKGFFHNEAKWIMWFTFAPIILAVLIALFYRFMR